MNKLEKIYERTRGVLDTINAFFDLVKLEAGEYALVQKNLDLCELCHNEIVNYYGILEEAGFTVDVDIPDERIEAAADAGAIRKILSNLVLNAVKYGADGNYLKLRVYETDEKGCLEMTDKGKGIVEDSQEKIFERLATLEDSRNKKYQGSGLGLTVTKRLAENMGGASVWRAVPMKGPRSRSGCRAV